MLYFREEERKLLDQFAQHSSNRAMAVYGRRRTGKTALVLDFFHDHDAGNQCVYFQCASFDYDLCLIDFKQVLHPLLPDTLVIDQLTTFRQVFQYLSQIRVEHRIFIIDEFPFLAKKNEDVTAEFQWIIDHGLGTNKIILLGSSLSFMKRQIGDREAPLYGRFDKVLELLPFSFENVHALFPVFEDAVAVYARTGGVAQYVMLYKNYPSVMEADAALFFTPYGQLFQEAENLLMQEVREVTTYMTILRTIGTGEKESGQIADKCGMDPRAVFTYLNKLIDLDILSVVANPLSPKQKGKRYMISDLLYRFHFSFIDPRVSMITVTQEKAIPYILNHQYSEYLGFVYESIIRTQCFHYGLRNILPFMPFTVGKWWGNIQEDGVWKESEIDVIAFDDQHLVIGECKYRNKAVGTQELKLLQEKGVFVQSKGRELFYLLASKSGFTEEVQTVSDDHVILIDQI
ncbi:MAG: ATP-binding protein [Clostridia bacterium]|nr:ATP-binding protein [Clostridia bacterium]